MADAYSAQVVDHFDSPRNTGRLATASNVIASEAGSRSQGTRFHLSARIEGDSLSVVHFEAYGCPHCIAAGSWLTEQLHGATLGRLEGWTWREVAEALAVPAQKRGHLLVLEDAVRRLADAWRRLGQDTE